MSESLYCVNHPKVETYLRCNRCGVPICPKCAVRTEVGYRCPACTKRQQQVFYAGFRPFQYLVAGAIALPLGLLGGWLIPALGWFSLFLGPLAGVGIAEAVRWAIRRRRGPHTWLVAAGCVLIGGLFWLVPDLTSSLFNFAGGSSLTVGPLWSLLWRVVYLVGAVGAAAARLRPPAAK
ncbi:MAG: hypothetical protein PVH62_04010 [Anaerolineae bacterium]|jgi:hypothetical protein